MGAKRGVKGAILKIWCATKAEHAIITRCFETI
jgi:hypothetical protein